MPVTKDKPAPYATASSVLDIVQRHRDRGLPAPVNTEVLGRAGIPDSLIPRTLQALETLDLIDEQGAPTKTLEALRLAPESEFKQRLSEWLKNTYADVFAYVDPSKDDEVAIRDAFRSYNPVGQQPRMVTLFLGLAAAAGLVADRDGPNPKRSRPIQHSPRRPTREFPQSRPAELSQATGSVPFAANIPAPIAGLLSRLPKEGDAWSKSRRDQFVATFAAIIDFCYRIEDDPVATASQFDEEEAK